MNYLILLELPFDPPPSDEVEIKAAIQKKYQQWSRMHDHPETRSAALHYMELIPDIQQVLLDPEKRQSEAEKAKETRQQMLAPFVAELRVLETKGYLHPRESKTLLEKYGRYGISHDVLQEHLQVAITDKPPKVAPADQGQPALDFATVLELEEHLQMAEKESLYDFLSLSAQASPDQLVSQAQKLLHQAFHAEEKDGLTAATQRLAELAAEIFESATTKESYDKYLEVREFPQLNGLIQQEFRRSGFISPDMLIRLVNFGVTTEDVGVLDLEEHIRNYGQAYHIPVDMAAPEVTCPNCQRSSPRGTVFCSHCAAPLEGDCPQCGTFFSDGALVCSQCSFPVGHMGKALPYVEQAETALIENNWSAAQHSLQYIQQYWPYHPKLEELERRAHEVEENYTHIMESVETAVQENRYYAALEILEAAKQQRVNVPSNLEQRIAQTLTEFEKQLVRLQDSGQADFDTLHGLSGHVADSLELGRLLAKYPPEPPSRFTARPEGDSVELQWGRSISSGMLTYAVVRKEGSVPLTAFDGDVIYQGSENTYTDDSIPPLGSYYYSVFVKRGTSYSEFGAVAASPIQIVPDVKEFAITPGDGAAQLTWTPPENLDKVRIWRKLGGDKPTAPGEGIELQTSRRDGFTDKKVKNDVGYWYYVVATYLDEDGKRLESPGRCESITPHKLVAPVDQFSIVPHEDARNRYLVNWEGAPQDEIVFFHSQTKPAIPQGKMVPVDHLTRIYNRLPLEGQSGNSAVFYLRFSGGIYVFPVVIAGRFGAMGSCQYLTNIPDIDQLTYDIVENDLFINFRWPMGIQSVTVAWRKDDFPTGLEQRGTTSVACSRQQYDYDAGVRIPNIGEGRYYFRLYATFLSHENRFIYSQGEDLLVDNLPAQEVFYTIDYHRPLFSSAYNVSITVQSAQSFRLPHALLVGKEGSLPLSITDGTPLFEVESEQEVHGAITFDYKTEKLPKNLFVRLFFFDEDAYRQLRPLPGKSLMLT